DVHLVITVDEDVRDTRILQQLLERAQAEDLVQDVGDKRVALEEAERRVVTFAFEEAKDQILDLRLGVLALDAREALEIEPPEQLVMDAPLQLVILRRPHVRRRLIPRRREQTRHDLDSWVVPFRLPNRLNRPAGFSFFSGFSIPASDRANAMNDPASSL